jgi:tetratricopeptide (TPR) repeat protein
MIPDGGILPRDMPGTVVVDGNGGELKHGCLWHDPEQSMALVFAPPAAGKSVYVYARKATKLVEWAPATGLVPGTIAYMKPGGEGLEAAYDLKQRFPPGKGVYFAVLDSPGLGALPQGLEGPFSDYILGHLVTTDPGKTWMAIETSAGAVMELTIDGRRMNPTKEFPQLSGSQGEWFTLKDAPCRFEIVDRRPVAASRVQLAWKPPHAKPSELGGMNPVYPKTTMWAARPILPAECVRSGEGKVTHARFADGSPVPAFSVAPRSYVWLDETPVVLYSVQAEPFDNPQETVYEWEFDNAVRLAGARSALWLFEANRDCRVELTARQGKTARTAVRVFRSFCSGTMRADLNNGGTEDELRTAFLNMVAASPLGADPTAGWSASIWALFHRVLDPVRSRPLLAEVFKTRWQAMSKTLDEKRRWAIEDMYFDMLVSSDPKEAMNRALSFEKADARRRGHWQLKRVELFMYYMDDLDAAEKLLRLSAAQASAPDVRIQIRSGDIAFLRGNYAEATRVYAMVQNRVNHTKEAGVGVAEGGETVPRNKRERRIAKGAGVSLPVPASIEDWRVGAVRETAVSENVRTLIQQERYSEAKAALEEWEGEFPLSKLSADYLVVEAKLLMKLGNSKQGARTLIEYCKAVDSSTYLPEAMVTALSCMTDAGASDAALNDFVEDIKRRFKNHPLSADADGVMARLKKERSEKQ